MERRPWRSRFAGLLPLVLALCLAPAQACKRAEPSTEVLARVPLDSLDEVITKDDVALDRDVTADGRGSIRIETAGPRTVRIAEIEVPAVDDARLIYRARLRTKELRGKAYLEMWCVFPGRGEYFSRALQSPLVGTNEWVSQETPFLLQQGQTPSRVKLNLVVDGPGTVWIDEIELAKAPL